MSKKQLSLDDRDLHVIRRRSSPKNRFKYFVCEMLEVTHHGDLLGKAFDNFMIVLISLNVIAFAFETVYSISIPYKSYFNNFETFSVAIFTIEYFLRLWTCTLEQRNRHPIWGRLKFILRPLSVIDLLAVLPYYLFVFFPNLVFIREIHLLRLARLLKIGRYSGSMRTLGKVVAAKRHDLLSAIFTVFTLLMFSASLVYFAEHASQPQLFSSIPASMWWSVVTLTSVGYGDVYPITLMGKLLGGVISVLGLGLVALPTGILASGFAEEVQRKTRNPICPHCGKHL
jgi:voltage-gated potassium channel